MRKYLMRALVLTLVGALLATGALSCSSGEAKETYKVGAIFSLHGAYSNLGEPEENTVEMMVKKINDEGGINGHPLEVIVYSDKSNTEEAAILATRLIEQDEVLAIIGPSTTGSSMAILETVTSAKVPLVSAAAGLGIISPVEERYWVFKTPQTDLEAVTEVYTHLQETGVINVALLTATSAFGTSGRNFLMSEAPEYGITIVDDQTFSSDDTNMQSQLTHIRGTDAEAVVCWDTDKASAIVAQDMRTLQIDLPLYMSHGIANPDFIDNAGEAANGVIFPAGKLLVVQDVPDDDPQKEVLTNYKADYEALYGEGEVNTFGGHAYDALSMVVIALKNIDEGLSLQDARQAVRDEIEKISDFAGTGGIFTMSPENHLGMAPGSLAMIEIVDGEWTWLK